LVLRFGQRKDYAAEIFPDRDNCAGHTSGGSIYSDAFKENCGAGRGFFHFANVKNNLSAQTIIFIKKTL